MSPARLKTLIVAINKTVTEGYSLELATRAEVFAQRLSPADERQLREALSLPVDKQKE